MPADRLPRTSCLYQSLSDDNRQQQQQHLLLLLLLLLLRATVIHHVTVRACTRDEYVE